MGDQTRSSSKSNIFGSFLEVVNGPRGAPAGRMVVDDFQPMTTDLSDVRRRLLHALAGSDMQPSTLLVSASGLSPVGFSEAVHSLRESNLIAVVEREGEEFVALTQQGREMTETLP